MSLYETPLSIRSDKIRTMHRWWLDHCGGDIPDRADFDPAALTALLPNLIIADVETDPFQIRFRLVGTKVVRATGFDFTNRSLDELIPVESDEPWVDNYKRSFEARRPVFGTSPISGATIGYESYEFALFPLRHGSFAVGQFLAVEDYFGYTAALHQGSHWRVFIPTLSSGRSDATMLSALAS